MIGKSLDVQRRVADPAVLLEVADAALRQGDHARAVEALYRAAPDRPDDVRLLVNLGGALKELGRFDEAMPVLARAVALDPLSHGAWSNLGTVSLELQRYDDAIAAFSNAIRLKPDHLPALSGLGVALRRRGLPREALPFFDLAISISPHDPDVRTWRAMALLAAGDYLRGFVDHEWRLNTPNLLPDAINTPRWKGEPLAGRTLLVRAEGGLGDCLQFCRYIPLLRQMDCRIVVQMPEPLLRLLSRLPGIEGIVDSDDPLPPHDVSCSVMSLPYVFRTTIDTVPFADRYLQADQAIVRDWQALLDADVAAWRRQVGREVGAPLKVGLVWSGGKRAWHLENTLMDRRRSMRLSELAPLAAAGADVLFYSLQIGGPSAEAAQPPPGLNILDHTARIGDFDDTAGLVSLLDLVITVDTSTAHLAAAMGRPIWLLSRFDQCWRWLPGRTDSPWYSSMRIYTQPSPFDWGTPVSAMATHLGALAGTMRHALPAAALQACRD